MSANDGIDIVENGEGKFEVSIFDMDSDWHSLIGTAGTLKEAIIMANKYMKKRTMEGIPVEYGMNITFKEEQ